MENFDKSAVETDMRTLREGIKTKYQEYHSFDRDRFPNFEYNTNRANYEPLKDSFIEEFYVVRGLDRAKNNIHIPSTNTLALLFCDDSYVPGKKILDTCRSYAEGKTKVMSTSTFPAITPKKISSLALAGLILVAGLVIYAAMPQQRLTLPVKGLVVQRPAHGETVPRQLLVEGRVSNADTVWIVIHALGSVKYWVQPPIHVEADDTWKGGVYIGSVNKGDIGVTSQLRAFVNPAKTVAEGDVLSSWPEAELSSNAIEVVRGNQEVKE